MATVAMTGAAVVGGSCAVAKSAAVAMPSQKTTVHSSFWGESKALSVKASATTRSEFSLLASRLKLQSPLVLGSFYGIMRHMSAPNESID